MIFWIWLNILNLNSLNTCSGAGIFPLKKDTWNVPKIVNIEIGIVMERNLKKELNVNDYGKHRNDWFCQKGAYCYCYAAGNWQDSGFLRQRSISSAFHVLLDFFLVPIIFHYFILNKRNTWMLENKPPSLKNYNLGFLCTFFSGMRRGNPNGFPKVWKGGVKMEVIIAINTMIRLVLNLIEVKNRALEYYKNKKNPPNGLNKN